MKQRMGRFRMCNAWMARDRFAAGQELRSVWLFAAIVLLVSHAGHAQAPIGWRTDGTGAYPKAQPPLEWSPTKNVVWSTPMPGYGVSHPVPLGRYVFICSEPATLLCINRDDGKIVWQKT